MQSRLRRAVAPAPDLRAADQLPDRAARHRKAAPHSDATAHHADIEALVAALSEVWTRFTLRYAA
jgi:hypothetical protein